MNLHGFHPLREVLERRPGEVVRIWVAPGRGGDRRREIESLAAEHGIPVQEIPTSRLDELAGFGHNGFAAELRDNGEARPAAGDGAGPAAAEGRAAGPDPDLLVLVEDVQDPRNLGALLRVCDGAGVGRVLVRDRGSAPLSATVAKTSAGASEWVAVERVTNTAQTLGKLQEEGFWAFGAAAEGVAPWEADLTGKAVLCFGGEEKGLRRLTRERCDVLVGLPMRGHVASLNLATAASALLYEAVRQRLGKRLPVTAAEERELDRRVAAYREDRDPDQPSEEALAETREAERSSGS